MIVIPIGSQKAEGIAAPEMAIIRGDRGRQIGLAGTACNDIFNRRDIGSDCLCPVLAFIGLDVGC
jgi:hypothetical protein